MSIECGECERDLRAGHAPTCSRSDTNPTPLERLEAWRKSGQKLDYIIFTDFSADHTYTVELWGPTVEIACGTGDTLDAAILAALAQAEGER